MVQSPVPYVRRLCSCEPKCTQSLPLWFWLKNLIGVNVCATRPKDAKIPFRIFRQAKLAFAFTLKPFTFTWLRLLTGQVLIVPSFYICAGGTPLFLCYIIDSVPKNIPFRNNHRLYIHFASLNICITVDACNVQTQSTTVDQVKENPS